MTSDLNVFLQLLGVGEAAVPGAAVGDEPGDGLRLVGRHVDAAHRRVPAHVLVVVLRRKLRDRKHSRNLGPKVVDLHEPATARRAPPRWSPFGRWPSS